MGGDGIFVPVHLDVTGALSQWNQLQKQIASQATTTSRENSLLDEIMGTTPEHVANRNREIADYQRKVRDTATMAANAAAKAKFAGLSYASPFSMNMGALGGSSYRSFAPMSRSRAYSNDYLSMQTRQNASQKSAYENSFQNRYLSSEIADGSYKKKAQDMLAAERAAAALQKRQDQLLAQGRLIQRQARYGSIGGRLAHLYGENAGAIGAAAGMAGNAAAGVGRGAVYAGVAVGGLTASGFSGTVEGERFAREVRVLSLELAASFKPLMDVTTETVRGIRKNLQSMGPGEQDRLQRFGITAAGAYAGYRVGRFAGPYGGAAGAAVGATAGYFGPEIATANYNRGVFNEGKTSPGNYERNADLFKMSPEERTKAVEVRRNRLLEVANANKNYMNQFDKESPEYTQARMEAAKAMVEIAKENNALKEIGRRTAAGESLDDLKQQSNPNRRQLMITEGVGFHAAGSTFFALQEDLTRTVAAESQKQSLLLEGIKTGVENLNKP